MSRLAGRQGKNSIERKLDNSLRIDYLQFMKTAAKSVNRSRIDLGSETFSLSSAKAYLGRLIDKAGNGEAVYIVRGQRRFLLQEVPQIDPIPMRPPGYFARCYNNKAEIAEENSLAKASVVRPPEDLE